MGKKNKSLALTSSGQHLILDSFTTFAVSIGIGIVLLTNITGIDAILAILMSFWIIYNGYKIIRASLAGIMDEADLALLEEVNEPIAVDPDNKLLQISLERNWQVLSLRE